MTRLLSSNPKFSHPTYNATTCSLPSTLTHAIKAHLEKTRSAANVIKMPVKKIKKVKDTTGVNSIDRETKHFSETTTMHGPKRIYQGKGWAMWFWLIMVLACLSLLGLQTYNLVTDYLSKPILSQVSFIVNEKGIEFPHITICNFNPIRKSYVKNLNKTGDFSFDLLNYMARVSMDTFTLYAQGHRERLNRGDHEYREYLKKHPDFIFTHFLRDAAIPCKEALKRCSVNGRLFDCCKYATTYLTHLGNCYTLNLTDSDKKWMRYQVLGGPAAGVQLVLDTHLEEQIEDASSSLFSNSYENGYRFYLHSKDEVPYLASEGISASPKTTVYSAMQKQKTYFGYPPKYVPTKLPYSAANCKYLCAAFYFNDTCGCSPYTYNIDGRFDVCTPMQTINCIDHIVANGDNNNPDLFQLPACDECKLECQSTSYTTYNSYSSGFNNGAINWLDNENSNITAEHIRENYVVANVFYREISTTEYSQVQGTGLTELLSNIGGNMGMFLGMSLITITEISMYFSKVLWICVSRKRRDYMYWKKHKEIEKNKHIDQVVEEITKSRRNSASDIYINKPHPGRDASDLSPIFPFHSEFNTGLDINPGSRVTVDGNLNVPLLGWGIWDYKGGLKVGRPNTRIGFGSLNGPTNVLGISPDTLASLAKDGTFQQARKSVASIPVSVLPGNFVPVRCKPPLCNPFVHNLAFGVDVEPGDDYLFDAGFDFPIPLAPSGVGVRFPMSGAVNVGSDPFLITYGHGMGPVEPPGFSTKTNKEKEEEQRKYLKF
ncbi:hypothetical protein WR25_01844 [Diploscapter pachys]|uniref:Uncharacterized protein n=1 Tax=Diploscapter pachys TaxID=2018661 RepID=A0A2A2JDB0_9BILA|nr:hypothetical protein WR25_01844 [Diploscapter pachys]